MYFGNIAPGGYAWIIPKSDCANVGLGVQNKFRGPLKPLLLEFLKTNKLDNARSFSAGSVPVSGPLQQTVNGNVLVVGDAAGHIMATNGGGIPIAMVCGRIAGNAIASNILKGSSLANYDSEWRKAVGQELATAYRTKTIADMVFGRDLALEMAMNLMGPDRMSKVIKCKPIIGKGR
jgi:digeranylgeranylglycerophospholipid reductase